MKIVSYRSGASLSYGVVEVGGSLDDLASARVVDIPALGIGAPEGVVEFLERYGEFAAGVVSAASGAEGVRFDALDLLPVIPRPGNIICVGVNYVDHADEASTDVPDVPLVFMKYTSSVAAHGSDIVLPPESVAVDYEGELAVVISRTASRVSAEDALDFVGGYVALNDVSARDFQLRTSQWVQGKSFPTFAPTGPYLVTPDEIPDPQALQLRLTIGDETLQAASTADMIFSVRHLVSYLSTVGTLLPGDIIATGTPSGVGAVRTPPRWLRDGDVVSVAIDGLPTLTNTVRTH